MTDPDDVKAGRARAKFLDNLEREILKGLPNEQERRAESLRNLQYYNLRGVDLISRREAESDLSFRNRPKRALPFARRVINVLCSKLYAPGPGRRIEEDDAATKWLESIYSDCLMNSLWQRVDRMSTLNGMAAFQVGASGDPARPIKVQVWSGWHEVIPYELPDAVNEVAAVVTIDAVDQKTRYTLWTDDAFTIYESEKLKPWQTSGGRVAVRTGGGPNPYGVIPFAFAYFELPTSGCDSVHGLGPFLSEISETIDSEMSDMAEAMRRYHTPLPVAYDCDLALQPVLKMGSWIRVNSQPSDLTSAPTPRLEYLQAMLDVKGGWDNIRGVIDSELEALGIPLTAYRMDSATLPSGAALVAEQKPLLDYAVERREPFRKYESELAALCLKIGGGYYGNAALEASAAGRLSLTWPPAAIDLPGPDRDAADQASVEMGLESRVMVAMRRFGMSRDQALEQLEQAIEDETELTGMRSKLTAIENQQAAEQAIAAAAGDPATSPGGGDGGDGQGK